MRYDVFISYSRKDYVDENENVLPDSPVKAILDFLDEKGVTYWFDKKGLYKGAEFVEVIADAIATSKMMIFLSSTNSNESIYTAGEIFEAIECGKLIVPIRVDDSKYNKKFKLLVNPLDYIDYSKSDAFDDLLKAIECEKAKIAKVQEEEAKRREELKKREWRKAVKEEIVEQAAELAKLKETRMALLESIYKKLRSIDVENKKCPVCGCKAELDTVYCQTCGWFFHALTEIDCLGIEADKSALILAKSRWESKTTYYNTDLEKELICLREEIKDLEGKASLNTVMEKTTPSESELKKWNWEAFFFSWIWGFANGIKKDSLICLLFWLLGPLALLLGPLACIYFGIYGTRMAWNAKSWDSWGSFLKKQQIWKKAFIICVSILSGVLLTLFYVNSNGCV